MNDSFSAKTIEQACVYCGTKTGIDVSPHNSHARMIRYVPPFTAYFRLLWRCPQCTWHNETETQVDLNPRKVLGNQAILTPIIQLAGTYCGKGNLKLSVWHLTKHREGMAPVIRKMRQKSKAVSRSLNQCQPFPNTFRGQLQNEAPQFRLAVGVLVYMLQRMPRASFPQCWIRVSRSTILNNIT